MKRICQFRQGPVCEFLMGTIFVLATGCTSEPPPAAVSISEPAPKGYELLPYPRADLMLGDRLDRTSYDAESSGCVKGDQRGPHSLGSTTRLLTASEGVNAEVAVEKIFSTSFSRNKVQHVSLHADNAKVVSLVNYQGDRTSVHCRVSASEANSARYLISMHVADELSFMFFGFDGNKLDLSTDAELQEVFPASANISGKIDSLGNLTIQGTNLIFEVRVKKGFPATRESIKCQFDSFCETSLLPSYQFAVDSSKLDEGKIALIAKNIQDATDEARIEAKNGQKRQFVFSDGTEVIMEFRFEQEDFNEVGVEFELVS